MILSNVIKTEYNTEHYPNIILKIRYDKHGKTYSDSRSWKDCDYTKEEAIEYGNRYLMHCDEEGFKNVIIRLYYNDELIFDYTNMLNYK